MIVVLLLDEWPDALVKFDSTERREGLNLGRVSLRLCREATRCCLTGDLLMPASSFDLLLRVGLRSRLRRDCCSFIPDLLTRLDSPDSKILASLGKNELSVLLRLLLFDGALLLCVARLFRRAGVAGGSRSYHSFVAVLLLLPTVLLRCLARVSLLPESSSEVVIISLGGTDGETRPCSSSLNPC